jgi:outer membrane protein TolC
MRKVFKLITFVFFLFVFVAGNAQEAITFDQALAYTLENNYDIRVAHLDNEKASNNADMANNGYLPTLSATGGYNWTYFKGSNKLINGEVNYDANNSYNYNAGLSLNYSLFDGQGRRFNYLRSKEAEQLSELQARALIENTILQLTASYFEAVRLQEAVTTLEESMAISKSRMTRIAYSEEYGQATALEVLNANVDLNTDSINLLNAIQSFENTKRNLNLLMGIEIDEEIVLVGDFVVRDNIMREEALTAAMERNVRLESAEHTLRSAELSIGSNKSNWIPSIGANAGYNYRGSEDPNGAFVTGNYSTGPTAGLSLNWNIFDGRNKTSLKNAHIDYDTQVVQKQRTEQAVKLDLLNAHGAYRTALFVLQAQDEIVNTARNNFNRSEESFKLGQIGSVEFRQAQLNLMNAELQLSQAKVNAKNSEQTVLALMGVLLD